MFFDNVPNWEIWLSFTVAGGILLPIGYKIETNWSDTLFWMGLVLLIIGPILILLQFLWFIIKKKKLGDSPDSKEDKD